MPINTVAMRCRITCCLDLHKLCAWICVIGFSGMNLSARWRILYCSRPEREIDESDGGYNWPQARWYTFHIRSRSCRCDCADMMQWPTSRKDATITASNLATYDRLLVNIFCTHFMVSFMEWPKMHRPLNPNDTHRILRNRKIHGHSVPSFRIEAYAKRNRWLYRCWAFNVCTYYANRNQLYFPARSIVALILRMIWNSLSCMFLWIWLPHTFRLAIQRSG